MIFGPDIKYFNELEINGVHVDDGNDTEDFTQEDFDEDDIAEEDETDESEEDNDLEDFTQEDFDEDDDNTEDDGGDNEAAESEESGGTEGEEDENDNVAEEDETDESEEDNDLEDFTQEDFDEDDDNTEDDDTEGFTDVDNDNNANEGSGKESDDTLENKSDGNTLADMEKALFTDLSPQQLAIKNNELLNNYIQLYETINTIFDNINKIPKTFDNTRPLTFIADQLVELKDMVNYAITTTYVTKTYIENMTYYKQALLVLEQLNSMLKAMVQKPIKS